MLIVTEHLAIREIDKPDLDDIMAYQYDPLYLRYYPSTWADRTPEEVRRYIKRFIDWRDEEPRIRYQLAMTLREDLKLIGVLSLRKPDAEATEAELGGDLAPAYWNLGYATEGGEAMLALGFEELGLRRIWSSTVVHNRGARRVLEKLGLRYEGEERATTLLPDGWADSAIYAMKREEWQARVGGHGRIADPSYPG